MDMMASIANMSMAMSQVSVAQDVSTAMMKKAMDTNADAMAGILEMMPAPAKAYGTDVGAIFDTRA